jgi:tetratricopeptide (TPR) repeat protein
MKIWFLLVVVFSSVSIACLADKSEDIGAQGVAAFKQGDLDQAIRYFNQAIQMNSNYVGAYYFRGLSYMGKTQLDNSISDLSHALLLNTNYADAYYFRGMCYLDEKKYNQSIADLSQSLLLKTNIAALTLRAYVYSCVTDYNSSIEDYNKLIQLNPLSIRAYLGRARAFILDGAFGLAIMDCNSALSINPDSVSAYQERGQAYNEEGDFDNAIADFSKAIDLNDKDSVNYYARGTAFVNEEKFSNAIPDFIMYVALNPDDSLAYNYLGWCRDETGDYGGALYDYQKAVEVDTNSAWACNNLAWELAVCPDAKVRNGGKALEYAKKACELTDWKDPAYVDTLAAAYAEDGNFDEAVKWEQKAIGGLSQKDLPEGQKALWLYQHKKPYHESPK